MTNKEKIGLGIFLMICGFCLITGQLQVEAAAPTHFGNFSASSSQVDVHGPGYAGGTQSVLEIFGLTQSISPSTLSLNLSRNLNPAGNYTVTLCAYPNELLADPCTQNVQRTWTAALSTLGTSPTWVTLDMGGTFLYPSVGYGIHIKLSNLQTGSNYLNVYTNTSAYADGTFFTARTGCTGNDLWNQGFLCADNTTLGARDMLFDIFGGSASTLTLQVNQNGPAVSFSGFCATAADQPDGWTLNSNLVDLEIQDVTSGTGTTILHQANCDPTQGTYSTESGVNLWNGNFKVTAAQVGTPHTYTATTNFTVTGSSKPNPSGFLTNCQGFEITDTLSFSALKSSVGCQIASFAYNVTDVAPFSWHRQVTDALTDSGTSTVQIAVIGPSAAFQWQEPQGTTEFNLFAEPPETETLVTVIDSGTDTGIANQIAERFPFLRTMAVMFLWLEVGVWLAGLLWIVIPLL